MKQTIDHLTGLDGQTVLMRVDFNVPLDGTTITDESRITAALPTIRKLLAQQARLVLCSHLSRPQKKDVSKWPQMSLKPVADRLGQLLGQEVAFAYNCVGSDALKAKAKVAPGGVLLLENTRFHSGEEWNSADFAIQLAKGCQVFVNDAFGACHRAHGSTAGVADILSPAVMGDLVARELAVLDEVLAAEGKLTVVLGGLKVSDKLGVVRNLLQIADTIIIGGAMAYTFLKANGHAIGKSVLEASMLGECAKIQDLAGKLGVNLLLPDDCVTATEFSNDSPASVVDFSAGEAIPADRQGLDIGPKSAAKFTAAVQNSPMVFWNGPMGVFEFDNYAVGTNALATALGGIAGKVVIGGGDSGAAIQKAGLADQMYHMCTGGGASLEHLEGTMLPGIAVLDEA